MVSNVAVRFSPSGAISAACGPNRIKIIEFNENSRAYSFPRAICIFARPARPCRLVKYGMQHTQKPQGCTYVNRAGREGCRVCRTTLRLPSSCPRCLSPLRIRGGCVVRGDASAWYVRIRVRDREYFFYLIYYEFYVRPSEHLFV